MNNYCRNCGEKLINQQVCEKCNTKVLTTRMGELNKVLAKKYIGIYFILLISYFLSLILLDLGSYLIYIIYNLLPLVLIIFTIYAKRKLKYSKFFNIVFWLTLFIIMILILFMLYLIISCEYQF